MNFDLVKNIHFIGIGGIGMSALARYFKFLGKEISGYDRTATNLTRDLEKEGISVYYTEDIELLPVPFKQEPDSYENLVIYTPAIPNDHAEIEYFTMKHVPLYKRAEILGEISKNFPTVAVAGTHGKTTTSSLLTFILLTADLPFVSFVGGINENFNSNLIINGKPEFMVTEADEYDRSFLNLQPEYSILTSMDADHLDIYENAGQMENAFREFAALTNNNQNLYINEDLKEKVKSAGHTYGLRQSAECHPENVRFESGKFHFDYMEKGFSIKEIELSLPGFHNLENTVAAIAMARKLGASDNSVKKALKEYRGVKRRFEYHIDRPGFTYIDDYAHHPGEINAVISSLKKMYPGRKITAVFQPHLFSRTRDLASGFAESLSQVDDLVLLDIYPAREVPIPGITSSWLLDQVTLENKRLCEKKELIDVLNMKDPDILLTLGAGDIDQLVGDIKTNYTS